LGFSLDEIKSFSTEDLNEKIKNYENQIMNLKKNIYTLECLSKDGKERKTMKTFINDENAIGKWELVGVAKTKNDFINNNLLDLNDEQNDDVSIKDLYLMENGKNYWVVSWTKGIIYICGNEYPYEINNDLMYVKFIDPINTDNYKTAVYKRIDRKNHTLSEIENKDDINIPFEKDEKLIGFWKSVDFVPNINVFTPNKIRSKNLFLEKISVSPDDEVTITFKNGNIRKTKYSRNYIINLCCENTLCKYIFKEINNKTYIIIEWKSGDYVFGKMINGYYVLEKLD
jgi:hypothetical protein